jgi:hypothetical protein
MVVESATVSVESGPKEKRSIILFPKIEALEPGVLCQILMIMVEFLLRLNILK